MKISVFLCFTSKSKLKPRSVKIVIRKVKRALINQQKKTPPPISSNRKPSMLIAYCMKIRATAKKAGCDTAGVRCYKIPHQLLISQQLGSLSDKWGNGLKIITSSFREHLVGAAGCMDLELKRLKRRCYCNFHIMSFHYNRSPIIRIVKSWPPH